MLLYVMQGWTALHYAASRGHVACIRILLDAGAKVLKVVYPASSSLPCKDPNGRVVLPFKNLVL